MEFEPIDHMVCSIANKRKTTIQELADLTKEDPNDLVRLLNYGISKNILTEVKEKDATSYTLTPYGELQLSTMNSIIIEGWKKITNAIQTKDIDTFMRMVKEYEYWIRYLRYTKLVSTEDVGFVLSSYKEILKSRQKMKKKDTKLYGLQNDAAIARTNALRKQQWEFDDQNYEITREYNEYVDNNYDNNYYDNQY